MTFSPKNSVNSSVCCFMNSGSQIQEMSTKAIGYNRVVEENRKLYNMVQDLKG